MELELELELESGDHDHGRWDKMTMRSIPHAMVKTMKITRPSRPIRCDVWIVERMRYPTDQPTNRPTAGHSQLEVLCRT